MKSIFVLTLLSVVIVLGISEVYGEFFVSPPQNEESNLASFVADSIRKRYCLNCAVKKNMT